MGVYKNRLVKPEVYHKSTEENSNNQEVYHYRYLNELLKEQLQLNEKVNDAVNSFQVSLKATEDMHNYQMENVIKNQNNLTDVVQDALAHHDTSVVELSKRIESLEEKHENMLRILEQERNMLEALLEQQAQHDTLLQNISERKEEDQEIREQFKKHDEQLKDFSDKLDLQQIYHQTVMERLDQQEGLIKRLLGELDHIRSIIFERSAYLLEKVETGFSKVTQPIQRFFVHGERKEKEEIK